MKYLTIFDVNAYRNLTYGLSIFETEQLIKEIKKHEYELDYKAYCTPYVPIELSYHLCDKKDPAFNICKAALVANYLHTSDKDGSFRMLADKESLIAHFLFQIKSYPLKNLVENVFKLAVDILADHSIDSSSSTVCPFIRKSVDQTESNFLSDVEKILKIIDSKFNGRIIFKDDKLGRRKALQELKENKYAFPIARALVIESHILNDREINPDEIIQMILEIIRIFKAPIRFYHQMLSRLVMAGTIDLHSKGGKWANWHWDIEHHFSIVNSSIESRVPIMITNDKAMVRNLQSIYKNTRIYLLKEYLDVIGCSI